MTVQPNGRLVWRKKPHEAGWVQARSFELRLCVTGKDTAVVGRVVERVKEMDWYWYARLEDRVPLRNSLVEPVRHFASADAAKADCLAYVRSYLK